MIKKIVSIIFFMHIVSLAKFYPTITKETQLTFIDNVTLFSEAKLLIIKRLSGQKLFEINGNIYEYDKVFHDKPQMVYWIDNKKKFPSGFLFDLNQDNAPLIKPIGYSPMH